MSTKKIATTIATLALALSTATAAFAANVTLLNVSYDPTRELYTDFNKSFASYWKAKTGDSVTIKQSHGGSGKQAQGASTGWRPTLSPWRWLMISMPSRQKG